MQAIFGKVDIHKNNVRSIKLLLRQVGYNPELRPDLLSFYTTVWPGSGQRRPGRLKKCYQNLIPDLLQNRKMIAKFDSGSSCRQRK